MAITARTGLAELKSHEMHLTRYVNVLLTPVLLSVSIRFYVRLRKNEVSPRRSACVRIVQCKPSAKKSAIFHRYRPAQNTHVLTIAQPKLFIDPAFAGFFKQLSRGQPKDCLYVIDEAKAHDMFIDCTIDKEQLQQWVRDWNGEKLGSFAEVALQILEVKTQHPYQIAAFVKDFDEDDIAIMARQASHFRLAYTRVEDSKSDPETGNTLAYHAVRFQGGQTAFVAVDSDAYERFTELDISAVKPIEISDTGHLTSRSHRVKRFASVSITTKHRRILQRYLASTRNQSGRFFNRYDFSLSGINAKRMHRSGITKGRCTGLYHRFYTDA